MLNKLCFHEGVYFLFSSVYSVVSLYLFGSITFHLSFQEMGNKLCGCCRAAFPAGACHRQNLRWRSGLVCLPRAVMSSDKLWARGQTLLTWRKPFSPRCFRAGARLEISVLYTQWLQPPLSLVSPWQLVGAHVCVMFALGSPPELSVSSISSKVSFSLLLVRKRT